MNFSKDYYIVIVSLNDVDYYIKDIRDPNSVWSNINNTTRKVISLTFDIDKAYKLYTYNGLLRLLYSVNIVDKTRFIYNTKTVTAEKYSLSHKHITRNTIRLIKLQDILAE